MRRWQSLILLLLLSWNSSSTAGELPSFSLEDCAWNATDIVLVTEGQTIDGDLEVLNVWKGSLTQGNRVAVPALAEFAPEINRRVTDPWNKQQHPPHQVTGSRMVLFLKKSNDSSGKWEAAERFKSMHVSVIWIEQGQAYGILQLENPGPSQVVPLKIHDRKSIILTEVELANRIGDMTHAKAALAEAVAISDLAEHAKILAGEVILLSDGGCLC